MRTLFLSALISLTMTVSAAWADQAPPTFNHPFTQVVAFGDSFSDNGFEDGHGFERYSNTLTWVEYLARMLNLGHDHDNWAWGGAMSDERNCNMPKENWSGLHWQIDEYLKALPENADISTVLFTIKVGSNDMWADQNDPAVTAKNIQEAMAKLAKAGAKHILYRETSAVLLAPGYLAGDYLSYSEPWSNLVNGSNAITRTTLRDDFVKEFPGVTVYYHETDPVFTKIKEGREGFKFEILDKKWKGTYTFPLPDQYMWWDEWHPMGQVHKLLAEDSYELLRKSLQ